MANIIIQQGTVRNWKGPTSGVELRISALESFVAADGSLVQADDEEYLAIACSMSGADLAIAPTTIISTVDAVVNPSAAYRGEFFVNGRSIGEFKGFEQFRISTDKVTTTWKDIAIYNDQRPSNPVDFTPYTKDQVNFLLGLVYTPVTITDGATTLNVSGTLFFKTNNSVDTTIATFTGDGQRHLVVIEFGDSHSSIAGFNKGNPGDVFLGYWNGTSMLPIAMNFN